MSVETSLVFPNMWVETPKAVSRKTQITFDFQFLNFCNFNLIKLLIKSIKNRITSGRSMQMMTSAHKGL